MKPEEETHSKDVLKLAHELLADYLSFRDPPDVKHDNKNREIFIFFAMHIAELRLEVDALKVRLL